MFFRASTRNTAQSPNKYAILEETPTPVWMHFSVHHRAWRSWSCVKLLCLCARLRLGVVPTYYPVNSWPSRSSSCEESLFPCLHTHIVEDFKLPPRNWRCWNALLQIFQNFPFSETHHFAAVTESSARPKISQKIGLKTSSETRLLGGSRFGFWKQNTTNHDEKYPLMPVLFESVDFMWKEWFWDHHIFV